MAINVGGTANIIKHVLPVLGMLFHNKQRKAEPKQSDSFS